MTLALFVACLIGICIGSFLNVVIFRLPAAMAEGDALDPATEAVSNPLLSVVAPRSRCIHCAHALEWWENIPLFSFLILRARCSACAARISSRYPFVEASAAIAAWLAVERFGVSWQAMGAATLLWALIALSAIDLEHRILPDIIVLPMLWTGLCANCVGLFATADEAVLGAVAGYGSLWLIFQAYRLATGKEALGYGDFKLSAMAGAWLGFEAVPIVLAVGFLSGTFVGLAEMARGRAGLGSTLPFGPMLALGAVAALFGQEEIYQFVLIVVA